jgi:hypothetical protein
MKCAYFSKIVRNKLQSLLRKQKQYFTIDDGLDRIEYYLECFYSTVDTCEEAMKTKIAFLRFFVLEKFRKHIMWLR